MPSGENPHIRLWAGAVLLTPLWWVSGLSFMVYQITAFLMLLLMIHQAGRSGAAVFLPRTFFFLSLIILIYGFSFAIHAGSYPEIRSVASIYNLSFWLTGIALVAVLSNVFTVHDMPAVLRVFPFLAFVAGGLAAAMLVLSFAGVHHLAFPTPLYGLATRIFGAAPLIDTTFYIKALSQDWFASFFRPRFNVFAPYPTAAGGVLGMMLILLWTWACVREKTRVWWVILLVAANFMALCMTLSRTAILGFVMSFILVMCAHRKRFFFGILFILMALFFLGHWIEKGLDWVLVLRQGSSDNRLSLYRESLSQLEGVDWFIGLGLKPREEVSNFPVGSHSTYLSVVFKTGVTGLAIFILMQANLFWRWYRLGSALGGSPQAFFFWRGLGWVFCFMVFWMMTDDIDAPQFVAFLYFSMIGIFEGFQRGVRK